jgi:glycerol-3-phosphate dehydrogenase subunit C
MTDGTAAEVADAVMDICGYLLDRHAYDLARQFYPVSKRALYHGPCQLRGHGLGLPAAELMATIPGLELMLRETCRWNIAQASGIPCVHPVEILAQALSGA